MAANGNVWLFLYDMSCGWLEAVLQWRSLLRKQGNHFFLEGVNKPQ